MYLKYLLVLTVFFFCIKVEPLIAALSCSITTASACTSPSVIVLRMASSTNAHSEMPNQTNATYASNVICCGGVSGLANTCSSTFSVVAKLSSTTSAHIEQNTQSNYANNTCLSVPSGSLGVGYQASNCTGYDTTLASMPTVTNSQIGSPNDYSNKICGSYSLSAQTLAFSISNNSVGFGSLSSSAIRYATGDTNGTTTEAEAHQINVSTNASSGYTVSVKGATLTAGSYTINTIGSTNTAPSANTEQFGLRMTATGGSGTVSSPYAASGFAYGASASVSSQVAGATAGDGTLTTYSVRYLGNIAGDTENSVYQANLVYTVTANF